MEGDAQQLPFEDASFSGCVSNYVLEHVEDAEAHFREVARVLRRGGAYLFRTPNRWHYVAVGSGMLPHFMHVRMANRLRKLSEDAHEPWKTFYRANSGGRLRGLAREAGLGVSELRAIEPEPSYGAAHAALFYPMMAYERTVNSLAALEGLRANFLGVFRKPTGG